MTETLYCERCGDAAETIAEDGAGPCCHELPNPWHRGADGLYNQTSESPHAEDEDEPEDERPRCHNCESTEWLATQRQSIDSSHNEPDDSTIWIGEMGGLDVECANCGRETRHSWDYA